MTSLTLPISPLLRSQLIQRTDGSLKEAIAYLDQVKTGQVPNAGHKLAAQLEAALLAIEAIPAPEPQDTTAPREATRSLRLTANEIAALIESAEGPLLTKLQSALATFD